MREPFVFLIVRGAALLPGTKGGQSSTFPVEARSVRIRSIPVSRPDWRRPRRLSGVAHPSAHSQKAAAGLRPSSPPV
jgi:hypothetical protein